METKRDINNNNGIGNAYEEARKQRLEENKKRFEDLGIVNISKSLSDLSKSNKNSQQRPSKLKSITNTYTWEPRRSSRAHNPVPSYRDDVDVELPPLRKRSRENSSSWTSYLARPVDEVKTATYEERVRAIKAAEELQSSLQSGNPSFVKSMVRSHVYSCFWLGLPTKFCKDYLSKTGSTVVLEDENGKEYEAVYIGGRTGLSGGWRGFALEKKLDDGDAMVFELVEQSRFKVYTIRASSLSSPEHNATIEEGAKTSSKGNIKFDSKSNKARKLKKAKVNETHELSDSEKLQPQRIVEEKLLNTKPTKKNGSVSPKLGKKGELAKAIETKEVESVQNREKCAFKSRKKPAPRLFRKKAR